MILFVKHFVKVIKEKRHYLFYFSTSTVRFIHALKNDVPEHSLILYKHKLGALLSEINFVLATTTVATDARCHINDYYYYYYYY